jgi:hypothetical protein
MSALQMSPLRYVLRVGPARHCIIQILLSGDTLPLSPMQITVLASFFAAHSRGKFRIGTGLCEMPLSWTILSRERGRVLHWSTSSGAASRRDATG